MVMQSIEGETKMNRRKAQFLKTTSLVVLTLQNSLLGLSMRYARTRPGTLFLPTTAVVMAEILKLVLCLAFVFLEEEKNYIRWLNKLHFTVVKQPMDTLKVCVPSLVYIVQNNLLYVSATHLDAATYQVTYQVKILTTALFTVFMLKRSLHIRQWTALIILVMGIIMVQLTGSTDSTPKNEIQQSRFIGFTAALSACVLSGFAGTYFEMILKGSDVSVWMRNVQLSLLSLPFGLMTCLLNDWQIITKNGFFQGYNTFVVYLICLQAFGGLIVAVVVKYADNILKGFATSLAIVISSVASVYIFDFSLTAQFISGAVLVIVSIFLYSVKPPDKSRNLSSVEQKV